MADDGLMAREAFEEMRMLNVPEFVEDGEELMDYLWSFLIHYKTCEI